MGIIAEEGGAMREKAKAPLQVLVIGGTLFFGIPMIHRLLEDGHHVTIATRGRTKDEFGVRVERLILDRENADSMRSALEGRHFDVVIDKIAYCSNDIRAIMDIIDCDRYIYMSSAAVYELGPDIKERDFDGAAKELVWCDSADFAYDEIKRQAECALCQRYGDRSWLAVRYPYVIGKDDYTNRLLFYVEHVMRSVPMYIDDMDSQLGFIRSDEAGAFLAFLAGETGPEVTGAVNGCSGGTVSLREIIGYVEEKTGKKAVLDSAGEEAPYNGCPDYSINTDRAQSLGFSFSEIHGWIYELLDYYIDLVRKKKILEQFALEGEAVSIEPHGGGHINRTFLVKTKTDKKYILQEINTDIFRDTAGLMENVVNVTSYLRERIVQEGGRPERETITVIPTVTGAYYYTDEEQNDWRVYLFIEDAVSLEQAGSTQEFYESGVAFGRFQAQLADYPAETLHETIPNFHNTPKRYLDFEKAVEEDVCKRADSVAEEIAFIRARKEEIPVLTDLLHSGKLPLRITHNDTKLSNILLDPVTYKAVCVVDLDTIMPGLCAYDFGDAIRFGANTATEDEQDLSKVSLSVELYQAYAKGFLEGCGGRLTPKEIEMLPMGAKTITLEQGIRFLTDYLQGDTYYHTTRAGQNLDRCRTQLALVADMERKWEQMAVADMQIV